MKKQSHPLMSLKKLKIAKLNTENLHLINAGDCLPTEPTWELHDGTRFCPTVGALNSCPLAGMQCF